MQRPPTHENGATASNERCWIEGPLQADSIVRCGGNALGPFRMLGTPLSLQAHSANADEGSSSLLLVLGEHQSSQAVR